MDSEQREQLALRVLDFSGADQTEVMVLRERNELTRFTHNAVHQNIAAGDVSVRVRAVVANRSGVVSTNLLDDTQLRAAAASAIEMARHSPEDPQRPDLPAGAPTQTPPGAFVPQTDAASPQLRARMCEAMFATAEASRYWCAGFVSTGSSGVTIVNSNGARTSFDGTDAAINVKMNAADSTGYAEGFDNDVARLDAQSIGQRSARKARDSASPRSVEPGEWTIILEPAAFGELFIYLRAHFSAQAYNEGSSFLSEGLDKPYVGSNVTVSDDYAHPLSPGMPFDYEGQPTQRLTLIDAGVGRNVVTDSRWARKLDRPNTGHALPAPNAYGPQAMHLVVAPGSKPVSELIAETKRGLLVTRFWYIRTVDQKKAIVTGMTRDGTFLIENGELTGGVRNMRFNQSILEALNRCEFGNALHRTGSYSYSIVVPAVKIEGFRFTSGTEF